jgi:Na+-driven multidrug efflux pump
MHSSTNDTTVTRPQTTAAGQLIDYPIDDEGPASADQAEAGGSFDGPQQLGEEVKLLAFTEALKQEARFSLSFALSRVILAAQSVGYSIFISYCSIPYALSASTLMFMIQQGVYGSLRGWLSTTAVISGTLNGQQKFSKIGPAVNQGLLMALILGGVFAVPLFFAGDILLAAKVHQGVAEQAGAFLRAASYGLIPANLAFVDQVYMLSIKQLGSAVLFSSIQVLLSLLIGICWSTASNSLDGLGYGISIASAFTFILDRIVLYVRNNTYEKYELFKKSFDSDTTFLGFICLSVPTFLQALSEWLPTVFITALIGGLACAERALDAIEPSMMLLIIFNTILLGLGTAATVSTANSIGSVNRLENKRDQQAIMLKNTKLIGHANIVLTLLFIAVPTLFCLAMPGFIGDIFLDKINLTDTPLLNKSESTELSGYSQQWFSDTATRITGATFVVDGIRNTVTGLILGRKKPGDNYISSISNLVVVTGLATLCAYLSQPVIGPISYFATRLAGVSLMACGMYSWWCKSKDVAAGPASAVTVLANASVEEVDHASAGATYTQAGD